MAIRDSRLCTIYGKPYFVPAEVANADGVSVRISPMGGIHLNIAIIGKISQEDSSWIAILRLIFKMQHIENCRCKICTSMMWGISSRYNAKY